MEGKLANQNTLFSWRKKKNFYKTSGALLTKMPGKEITWLYGISVRNAQR
jgi:hypothetical protein